MPKKRILVTGGAGFIGSNFCNYHCQDPRGLAPERQSKGQTYDVVALDNLLLGDPEHLLPTVTFKEGDAADRSTLDSLGHFDFVIHFAGTSSAPMFHDDIVNAYRNSIISFLEVLEFADRTGAKKVLFASTSSLYGNTPPPLIEDQPPQPTNHYAVTKITMEHIGECYHRTHPDIEIIGFRFMSVYGPHEEHKGIYANLVSQFIWAMRGGKQPLIYGDGTQTRDLTGVADIVKGITLAMDTDKELGFNIFNIGTGIAVTVLELVGVINEILGTDIQPKHIENPVTEGYIKLQQADISKIQSVLHYQPSVKLKDGIRAIVDAMNSRTKRSERDRTHEANAIPKKA